MRRIGVSGSKFFRRVAMKDDPSQLLVLFKFQFLV